MPPPASASAASSSDPKAAAAANGSIAANVSSAAACSSSSPTRAADEDPLTCPLLVGDMVRVSEEYVPCLALPSGRSSREELVVCLAVSRATS
jgi:hypothetical protein